MGRTIFLLIVAIGLLGVLITMIVNKNNDEPSEIQIACESANGEFSLSSSNCHDYCQQLVKDPKTCNTDAVETCMCPSGSCWNGTTCVSDQDFLEANA